jgi:hypothetical protein
LSGLQQRPSGLQHHQSGLQHHPIALFVFMCVSFFSLSSILYIKTKWATQGTPARSFTAPTGEAFLFRAFVCFAAFCESLFRFF